MSAPHPHGFEVYQADNGRWRFRAKAGNGEIISAGEGYTTRSNARRGVRAVIRAAVGAEIVAVDA